MKRIWTSIFLCLLLIPAAVLAESNLLSPGAKGKEVVALQERLQTLGISDEKADGIYGKKTSAAVREAQRLLLAAGFQVQETGVADAETLSLLYDADAENALRTLRLGSKGQRVSELQRRLIDLKLLSGSADGVYGGNTEAAVRLFQARIQTLGVQEIAQDGVATPALCELLMSDLSKYGFKAPIYFDESQPLSLTAEDLYANSYILIDAPSGETLFANREHEQSYPASTTKMMTLLLAIEQGNLDRSVIVPESAANVPKDSSLVPVSVGEEMQMRDLLYGLMIRSGNDAANAVAELTAGSVEAFVSRMNARAQELGMTDTHFVNPHGYHNEQHYTTASDLAILARQGLTNADFCQIVTCLSYLMPATAKRKPLLIENRYEIFDPASPDYIHGAAGVKSGYTSHAGFCYVGAAQKDDRTLIAVVLGVPSRNRAWMDLRRLFAYGFATP